MTSARISKLLIANRGEIACRVIRSARKMGIETVAVYSEADKGALHVDMADEAHCIGPAASQASYLNAERILATARASGSHAIHPGYGFLSENAEFSERCLEEGVIFVGPPASAIRDMGIKNTSKIIMSEAGVPVIEGYHGDDQNDERLLEEARRIGFPVMLKAVRGGGGKGMRIAETEAEFAEQLASARREATKAFGDDAMLVERFVASPRHVEVQVFADTHGGCVHLFERDCSVQRRHQKVIEEAPAPGLTAETRREIGEAAVRAARAVGYVGAGTVEFVMDKEQRFFFMEMNTRLQVEHPVTEMITGVDLVEWQLRVAAGEPLPSAQSDLELRGHAVEARVYAEDSAQGFIPTAGRVRHLSGPRASPGLRVDSGVRAGDTISVHYDPMIAKLIVHAADRPAALQRLAAALADLHVTGPPTNVAFLRALALHPAFRAARLHTGFIPEHRDQLMAAAAPPAEPSTQALVRAALALCLAEAGGPLGGFRVNAALVRDFQMAGADGVWRHVAVEQRRGGAFRVTVSGAGSPSSGAPEAAVEVRAEMAETAPAAQGSSGRRVVRVTEGTASAEFAVVVPAREEADPEVHVFGGATADHPHVVLRLRPPAFRAEQRKAAGGGAGAASGDATAPMPGVVEKVLVTPGQEVEAGQALVTMIAMKMEYTIRAGQPGRVGRVLCREGDTVKKDALLVALEKEEEKEEAQA